MHEEVIHLQSGVTKRNFADEFAQFRLGDGLARLDLPQHGGFIKERPEDAFHALAIGGKVQTFEFHHMLRVLFLGVGYVEFQGARFDSRGLVAAVHDAAQFAPDLFQGFDG